MAFPEYIERNVTSTSPEGLRQIPILVCELCGRTRQAGDWPMCPHDSGNFGEEPLEPYFDEHISPEGTWITTRGQRRAIMNASHFEYRKKRTDLLAGQKTYIDMGRR